MKNSGTNYTQTHLNEYYTFKIKAFETLLSTFTIDSFLKSQQIYYYGKTEVPLGLNEGDDMLTGAHDIDLAAINKLGLYTTQTKKRKYEGATFCKI
jgi:hypothetical protein